MLCEITVEAGYLRVDLFNRETAEETRDALAAIAAEARKHKCSQILISVHASRPIFKVEQYGLPDYFRELGRIALTGDSPSSDLPAIHRVACATERDQRPELSQRTGGTLLVQGPALGAGPAPATGAMGGRRATPAPSPSQPGKHRSGLSRTHPRLRADPKPRPQHPMQVRRARIAISRAAARPACGFSADCSIASVTSSVRRASARGGERARLAEREVSSQARVSLAIGPQKSPSAQSPGVPLCRTPC